MARYLTGEVISSKTRSAEPRPTGAEPATATATAGRCAIASVTVTPVRGATGPADPVVPVGEVPPPPGDVADAGLAAARTDELSAPAEHPARAAITVPDAATAHHAQAPRLLIRSVSGQRTGCLFIC